MCPDAKCMETAAWERHQSMLWGVICLSCGYRKNRQGSKEAGGRHWKVHVRTWGGVVSEDLRDLEEPDRRKLFVLTPHTTRGHWATWNLEASLAPDTDR